MILAIEAFLDREIMAFEFDDRLQTIESCDQTVLWAIHELWKFYDDCTDHFQCLGRREWKYLQRLKLLLASDQEIRLQKVSYQGGVGGTAVVTLGVIVTTLFSADLWKAIPLALILSSFIAWWIDLRVNRSSPLEATGIPGLAPFHSFSELRTLRMEVPWFRRKAFSNRSEAEGRGMGYVLRCVLALVLWFFYSPIFLLLQIFQPFRHRVVVLAKP